MSIDPSDMYDGTDDKPTGRMSPLLCTDCEKFYGEVAENDTAAAVPLAKAHTDVCPKRGKPTGSDGACSYCHGYGCKACSTKHQPTELTDEQIEKEAEPFQNWDWFDYVKFARRIAAIVREDT